jgi:RNA polymerase sigma-70 factor, ECF subfamily
MGEGLDPVTQFRELYVREYASVYRAARAIVLDAAEAEDVAQDAFVRAYRARFRYRPTAPIGAWLHRIAVNTAISYVRRRRLARLLPFRLYVPPGGGSGYEAVEARSLVAEALAELSPKLRAVVALHYGLGYRRDEIAAVLGIPSGTVASRLAKAVAIMRGRLGVVSDQDAAPERLLDTGALP